MYVRLGSGSCSASQKTGYDICTRKTENDDVGRSFRHGYQKVQRGHSFIFLVLQKDGKATHPTCALAHLFDGKRTCRVGNKVGSADFRKVGRIIGRVESSEVWSSGQPGHNGEIQTYPIAGDRNLSERDNRSPRLYVHDGFCPQSRRRYASGGRKESVSPVFDDKRHK